MSTHLSTRLGAAGLALGTAAVGLAPASTAATPPPVAKADAPVNVCGSWHANTQTCLEFTWGTNGITPTYNASAGNANTFSFCGHFELGYASGGQWVHDRNSGTVCFPAGAWEGMSFNGAGDNPLNQSTGWIVTLWKDSGSNHYFMSNTWEGTL